MLFIGIDPAGKRNKYCMAVLDGDKKIQVLSIEKLHSVYAYLAGVDHCIVGLGSIAKYQHTERHVCKNPLDKLHFPVKYAQKEDTRAGVRKTKNQRPLSDEVLTIQKGIQKLEYAPVSDEKQPKRFFLSRTDEVFRQIASGSLLPLGTDASRWQRQLLLLDQEIPLPDVMQYFEEVTRFRILQGNLPEEMIYQHAELNAILLSWLGWLATFEPARVLVTDEQNIIYRQQLTDSITDADA